MVRKCVVLLAVTSVLLVLVTCGNNQQSPFQVQDASISLIMVNSSGYKDAHTVTDTAENNVLIGMIGYLPSYIDSVKVTIGTNAETDTVLTYPKATSWADTQWIKIAFHSAGTRTVTVDASIQGLVKTVTATVVVVGRPVEISTQPETQTVTAGQSVTFSVTVTGTAPITYQWFQNGTEIPGATSSSYTISNVQAANAGTYTVTVSNGVLPNATSGGAVLTVATGSGAPTITAQPQSQTITAGQSVTFSVTATGAAPLSYQWSQDGAPISGATSSSYTISNVLAANAGTYTVTISNGTLPNATSSGAVLTVTAGPVAPSITAQPQSQTITAGQSVTFSVTATGTAPLSYQWSQNGTAISGATSSSYTISNVQAANAGTYTVTVSNGTLPNATSSGAVLTVSAASVAPSITAQPQSQTITAGQSVTFSVTATGTAPLSYQWSQNGTAISGATSSSYSILNVQAANAGTYTVTVANGTLPNATSSGAVLTVNPAPVAPSIVVQPQSQTVTASQSVTFSVTATGTAPLSYQWSQNGTAISGATSSSYTIPNVQAANAGTYTVTIANGTLPNATSNGAVLTVNPAPVAPSIVMQPQSQTVTAGQSATFSVTASGTAPLSYQWSKNGTAIPGATSSSYTIPNAQAANAGTYTVTIANGTLPNATSSGAVLTVTPLTLICFWSNDATDGNLTVKLDGNPVGTLTQNFLYPSTPTWGAPGTLVTTVQPGTHALSAQSQTTISWPATNATLTPGDSLLFQFIVTQWCFWTNRSDVGSYINISIDNILVGQLTQYSATTPTWGQTGTLVVTTQPGTHTLYATSQGGTYWGPVSVSLTKGQQQLYELH